MPEGQVYGIRYGLRGFLDPHLKPMQLSRAAVTNIHLKGGTVLVSARSVPWCVVRVPRWLWVGGGAQGVDEPPAPVLRAAHRTECRNAAARAAGP